MAVDPEELEVKSIYNPPVIGLAMVVPANGIMESAVFITALIKPSTYNLLVISYGSVAVFG